MTETNANNNPTTLVLQGRTLYVTEGRKDVGLGLAAGAKAVTIQDENKETKVATNFADVASAIAHLADASEDDGFQYDGKVFAVLNDNGTAEWVVFVNNTALVTGSNDNNQGSGSGKLFSYNYTVTEWGQAFASLNYNRPSYVPSSATVTVSFDVFADGVWIDSVAGSLTGNGYRWQGYTKPGAKIELRNVVLTPSDVTLKVVDENGNDLLLSTKQDSIAVGTNKALTAVVDYAKYNAGSISVSVTGAINSSLAYTSGSGAFTGDADVTGNAGVVVTVSGLTKKAETYTATGLTATALGTLNTSIVAPGYATDTSKTITVAAAKTTGIAAGTPVTFTVTLSAAPAEADAYRVQISKLGIDGYVYTGHLTLSKVVNVNENITITAADVVVTPVALPAIQSVTWTANSVTVNFTKAVDVQTGTLAKGTVADSTAKLVDITETKEAVLSITYKVIDGALAANDTLTLTPANVTGNAYKGALSNTETTITLQADGTGKLS